MSTPIHLLDGGLGTTLTQPPFSCTFDASTPLWSSQLLISNPKTLLAAQSAFAKAGADIILTATYQASLDGFILSGVEDVKEFGRLMRSGVAIAKDAFDGSGRKGKVALSLGAYGACMIPSQEYTGKYDSDHLNAYQLRVWHLNRLVVFMSVRDEGSGCDDKEVEERKKCWKDINLVAFETIPLLAEIIGVRQCMSFFEPGGKPFWISCVFPGEENKLPDGSSIAQAVEAMLGRIPSEGAPVNNAPTPMGIGINCTRVEKVESLILEFEDAVQQILESGDVDEWPSLVVYPDGTKGEVYNTVTKQWEVKSETQENLVPWDETLHGILKRTQARGLWKQIFAGGCCQTRPEQIQKLRKRINVLETLVCKSST